MSSEVYGVLVINPALGPDEPVSVGCPLYNEASAVGGCLVLSFNVIAQRLDFVNRLSFDRIVNY